MAELIDTKIEDGEAVHTFKVPVETFQEVVYTDLELSERKKKLEDRIASNTLIIEVDQAELATINEFIELANG